MSRPRTVLLPLLLLLLFARVSLAQIRAGTVEISPFAGYLFGGDFPRGTNALFDNRVDVDDHLTYGARLGWNITSKVELEAQASRTETRFVTPGRHVLFSPDTGKRLGDLEIDYFLGYGTFNFGHGRVVPYVTLGAGAARLDPDVCRGAPRPCQNASTDTRFTASLGAGLKVFANRHFGFRFDGRYYEMSLRRDNRTCTSDRFDRCDGNRYQWLSNGDVTGGLVFAF